VHTIDREKIARRLRLARPAGERPLDVCIEVNASAEASKSGVAPDGAVALGTMVAGSRAAAARHHGHPRAD
jgi:uncharacterized pyridoxal phosphate-containing UPF0001 family protein